MNKNELQKTYQKIALNTNGGIDDYVVALCQIGNAIGELDDQQQKIVITIICVHYVKNATTLMI